MSELETAVLVIVGIVIIVVAVLRVLDERMSLLPYPNESPT